MQTPAQKAATDKYRAKKREEKRLKCLAEGKPFRTCKRRERLPGETSVEFRKRWWREFNAKHRDKRVSLGRMIYKRDREKIRAKVRASYPKTKDVRSARNKKWRNENPEKVKDYEKRYLKRRLELRKIRRALDPQERLKDACRTRVGFILRKAGLPKFNHTFELVGCSPDFFKSFLEAQFSEGMSWDNYGDWEIDHVMPIASFNLLDKDQRRNAFHYSNCKPLWKLKNRMKNDKCPGPHQPLLV